MECTQRLDYDLSQTQTETLCPEQIGFLGILGTKYPIKRGPNKIGRDPQTCSIILNLNSISRQHAVLNVLSGKNYMLMDLDSANRTRLNNKSLQAYIPVAIKNGDTVQFGEVFGIFRLLEEETELPCTQAVHVPDTPARAACRTRALVPESPDVSDKDDSFIMPSQPKPQHRKGPSNSFNKSSSKTTQPSGFTKIDNVFWKSSKKSNSFNLDDSNNSLNESNQNGDTHEIDKQQNECASIYSQDTQLPTLDQITSKDNDIFNAETQLPTDKEISFVVEDDIFNASTQLPTEISPKNKKNEDIYEADTQLPDEKAIAANNENIFEAETQLPDKKLHFSNKHGKSIHDIETQMPFPLNNESTDSIYTAETQLPPVNASPSIYSQETQLPKLNSPKSIYDVNTQLPLAEPNVSDKIDNDIFNAQTQLPEFDSLNKINETNRNINKDLHDEEHNESKNITLTNTSKNNLQEKIDKSDEIILFDEVETYNGLDDFNESQPIILGEDILPQQEESEDIPLSQSDTITDDDFEIKLDDDKTDLVSTKREARGKPDASIDCEDLDFLPTQKISENQGNEDELTDCEDEVDGMVPNTSAVPGNSKTNLEELATQNIPSVVPGNSKTNLEELATQVIPAVVPGNSKSNLEELATQDIPSAVCENFISNFDELTTQVIPSVVPGNSKSNFDELATQVIPAAVPDAFEDLATQVIPEVIDNYENKSKSVDNPSNEPLFEDMLTQVIPEGNCDEGPNFEDLPTQVILEDCSSKPVLNALQFSDEVVPSPFKIPLQTPLKTKKKEVLKFSDINNMKSNTKHDNDDDKYYNATQDILEDLCSQDNTSKTVNNNVLKTNSTGDIVPRPEEDHKVGTKIVTFDGEMEITVKKFARESSDEEKVDTEEKVNKFVKNLSAKQINEVIGVDVTLPKRMPSDASDPEVTPKKVRPFKFLETLLPNSQEIKTGVSLSTNIMETDSSSESEQEKESQEQTPIVFRKKKRVKADVKKNLTTKFDIDALPSRIITRKRKPTTKLQESDATSKKRGRNILKPKFLNDTEQEEDVDTEIITENITRLKNKNDKKKHKDTSADSGKVEEVKTESNKRKSNEENLDTTTRKSGQDSKNKSKNSSKNTIVDLTVLDKEVRPRTRSINKKSKNNKDCVTEITELDEVKSKDKRKLNKTDISKQTPDESRKTGRHKKKDVQEKITNYTVTTNESRISGSVSIVDESPIIDDKNNSTKSTGYNKDTNSEKSVIVENETTKRKRGRPRKEDKEKSKEKKEQKDKEDNSKERKRRKKDDKLEIEEQQEIRRSKRQKVTKEQNDSHSKRRCHEQSTVYNVSSESSVDSPKRKRIETDTEAPLPKRTRSVASSVVISSDTSSVCTASNNSSLRSTPLPVKTHYVLFTAFASEEVKTKLENLGAVVVSDVNKCSVVLTLQLRRTFKLLCCVGLGRPIVGPAWVQACADANAIVDPWQHILVDSASEARFKFSLRRTLAGARRYLAGCCVSATPHVQPSAPEMKLIVECSGGAWSEGGARGGRWLAVSCAADRALHAGLRARGATVVTSELILTGVLRQELDIQGYLFK